MFGAHTLIDNITVDCGGAAGCMGFVALWSNPSRGMNRAVFFRIIHVSVWLVMSSLRSDDRRMACFGCG